MHFYNPQQQIYSIIAHMLLQRQCGPHNHFGIYMSVDGMLGVCLVYISYKPCVLPLNSTSAVILLRGFNNHATMKRYVHACRTYLVQQTNYSYHMMCQYFRSSLREIDFVKLPSEFWNAHEMDVEITVLNKFLVKLSISKTKTTPSSMFIVYRSACHTIHESHVRRFTKTLKYLT